MLPNPDDFPSLFSVVPVDLFIAKFVPFQFFGPEFRPGGGECAVFCASVPKTRVDEDDRFVLWQNHIGFAKIFSRIFTITKTPFPHLFSKQYLNSAVSAFHSGHYLASFGFCELIHIAIIFYSLYTRVSKLELWLK